MYNIREFFPRKSGVYSIFSIEIKGYSFPLSLRGIRNYPRHVTRQAVSVLRGLTPLIVVEGQKVFKSLINGHNMYIRGQRKISEQFRGYKKFLQQFEFGTYGTFSLNTH